MARRCVVLFSGGLDSMLTVRIMQEHGIHVEALTFKTVFECCQDRCGPAARDLGVRLTVLDQQDDYLEVLRRPWFGYGKGANPCVDCRIYMFRRAAKYLKEFGADFVASGEVLGQRPMSQKRRDLEVIARHSELGHLLLRPLSAKLLPVTRPEREGWVDRGRLYAFQGRSRKGLIELGRRLGLPSLPTPSTGCALTEPQFAKKVFDLMERDPESGRWDFELLKVGRHFRLDRRTKIVVGRNAEENGRLQYAHELSEARSTARLLPENFLGPHALVIGPADEESIRFAAGLVVRYARRSDPDNALVRVVLPDRQHVIRAAPTEAVLAARTLASAV